MLPAVPPPLADRLARDPALHALHDAVRARMGGDAAHDLAHLHRVGDWTLRLLPDARREVGDPPSLVAAAGDADLAPALARLGVAAALLHDVVHVPKDSPARAEASTRAAAVARELLPTLGFAAADVEVVADAVRDHSWSYCRARGTAPESAVGRALQDADRLEALGALGVLRCVATGVAIGGALFDDDDPWASGRPLDDARFAVDHFQTKLLRLPPTLLTAAGRAEAERRAGVMVALLLQLGAELGVPYAGIGAPA